MLLLAASPALAQGSRPAEAPPAARRIAHAAQLVEELRIDGKLDEPAWIAAEPASDFTQAYPNPGTPASQRTEVRVLVGRDALYVGARMFDARPDSIAAQLSRRDVTGTYSDRIYLMLDTHNDRRTAFQFGVNPRGVKQDAYNFDDRREDTSWDAVWDVATTVDSLGWVAEFRIPYSQLRFSSRGMEERIWGLGLMRDIARNEERVTWSPWTRNSPGFVSAFGELHGLEAIRPPKRLEILPYTRASLERSPGNRTNPFYENNELGGSAGADVKYGLPGGLTLSATVNPDFGQVEVDPAVVNLTAFETFYPERRPFFVEGTDIFRFGDIRSNNSYSFSQFFYSRRIGRAPQRVLGGSGLQFVDTPDQSTILGAAKVSGKTAGGWSVGLMDALTGREEARYLGTDGVVGTAPVEPLSNYFVARVRRDMDRGNTVLGGIVTSTNRDMAGGAFDRLLRSGAYLAGVDGEHSWNKRTWTLSGYLAGSRVSGSRGAISAAQASSARYYQRPDADYLSYDTTRTALDGYIGALALSRSGKWFGSLTLETASPGFEINDAGFQRRVDFRAFSTLLGYQVNRSGKVFRDYAVAGFTTRVWNFGGERTYDLGTAQVNATFRNLWRGSVALTYNPGVLNDRLTFGGPAVATPAGWNARGSLSTDPRKRVVGSASVAHTENSSGAYEDVLGLSTTLRPSTSLEVSLGPSLTRSRSTDQFVLARNDTLARATYRRRYLFANVDQTRLAMNARVNWTFTPNLSLQVFAQPYVNSADFWDYKELQAPRTFDFAVYGKDVGTIQAGASCGSGAGTPGVLRVDPDDAGSASCFLLRDRDFTLRSLRGNAVLRWEYRPGSTVFLVWQQLRDGEHAFGEFDFGRDTRGIFEEPARNVFLVKMTYWIGQ